MGRHYCYSAGGAGGGVEIDPLHCPAERLDAKHHFAILKQPHRTGRFADRDRDGRVAREVRPPPSAGKTLRQR
jgi:hypothetical protein